jgi:hypothetical protein
MAAAGADLVLEAAAFADPNWDYKSVGSVAAVEWEYGCDIGACEAPRT